MRGEISSGKFDKRHPLDWYVEEGWEWGKIAKAIGPEEPGVAVWDPACGFGHSLSRLQGIGFKGELIASDLVDNLAREDFVEGPPPEFRSWDFVDWNHPNFANPAPAGPVSIWCNPPYSYKKINGEVISQAFARKALELATHRVVFLLPLKWLAGGMRGRFLREFPPQQILYFTKRPSMPPGDRIHLMGTRAYRGGQVDYCAVVWDRRAPTKPGETRSIWLPSLGGKS
ncbi:MAG: hypothetical protein U9R07_15725 [Pseudomonadota bacterium]|nr:hypothetical protein [Pseudomonadota bacterium]